MDARGTSAALRVTTLTTPENALAPYPAELEPRRTSMRSMSSSTMPSIGWLTLPASMVE